ncbi:hypothetical protein BsWGS_02086 [Bradybaena similaris]
MGKRILKKVTTEAESEIRKETTCPIAVGPCLLYRKPNKTRLAYRNHGLSLFCCCKGNKYTMIKADGEWSYCFLTLYADSTMNFHEGLDYHAPVIMSLRMTELYREVSFGEDSKSLSVQYGGPQEPLYSWGGVLAIPDVPHCNSKINWLDFLTQETLNKWLVAICRSLPASTLKLGKYWTNDTGLLQNKPVADELKSHIQLFFPRKDTAEL